MNPTDSPEYIIIKNGTVITPFQQIKHGAVLIKGGKILDIGSQRSVAEPPDSMIIDALGHFIIPGMIDIHVHGSNGGDALDATSESYEKMSSFFTARGVTGFLATVLTTEPSRFISVLDFVRSSKGMKKTVGARALGVHMEGPFLNKAQKGAHEARFLAHPNPSNYEPFLAYNDVIKMMTLAPELPGAVELVKTLRDNNIVASIGHSNGIYREMMPAIDAGMTHAVHFFCNMGSFRRDNLKRVAGAMETILYEDRITTELIGDRWHVGDILMKLAIKVKGPEKLCFVSDAMTAAGLPNGRYFLGGMEAIVKDGIAKLPDNSAYASSVTTMDTCVRNGIEFLGLKFNDAVRMATLTPAEVIGMDKEKGSIKKGMDADIAIVDKDIKVKMSLIEGRVAYQTQDESQLIKG